MAAFISVAVCASYVPAKRNPEAKADLSVEDGRFVLDASFTFEEGTTRDIVDEFLKDIGNDLMHDWEGITLAKTTVERRK